MVMNQHKRQKVELIKIIIIKIVYCGVIAKIKNTNKRVFLWRFPPAKGTNVPNMNTENTEDELKPDIITKDNFINFILSNETTQINGKWKGGSFCHNNFCVISDVWLSGLWIGDEISVNVIQEGILKNDNLIPNTENMALTCLVNWKDKDYIVFVTDDIMPQIATDTIFIWAGPNFTLIKMLLRGNNTTIDFPNKIIPSAGEHVQPEHNTSTKEYIRFGLNEEIGVPLETLSTSFVLPCGIFDDIGRDSRYSTWFCEQDGDIIEFGIERYSVAHLNIVLVYTEDNVEPKETEPNDQNEIKTKWWHDINKILIDYPEELWMCQDHRTFIQPVIDKIDWFRKLSVNDKMAYLY